MRGTKRERGLRAQRTGGRVAGVSGLSRSSELLPGGSLLALWRVRRSPSAPTQSPRRRGWLEIAADRCRSRAGRRSAGRASSAAARPTCRRGSRRPAPRRHLLRPSPQRPAPAAAAAAYRAGAQSMLRGVPQGGGASTAAAHGSERRAHRSAAELQHGLEYRARVQGAITCASQEAGTETKTW